MGAKLAQKMGERLLFDTFAFPFETAIHDGGVIGNASVINAHTKARGAMKAACRLLKMPNLHKWNTKTTLPP